MKITFASFFFFLSFSIFYSCNQVEGCTDPVAENFDAEADKDCCCSYYQLRLDVSHEADTLSFNYFSPYLDANNDTFEIQELAFLCSNFELITSNNQVFKVKDSINLEISNSSQITLTDDFTTVRPGIFINNIGDFLDYGDYSKLRFLVGLDSPASDANALTIDDASQPLSNQHSPVFFNGLDYNHAFFNVILPATEDSIRFILQDTIWIELDYDVSALDGKNTDIPIAINYLDLFDGVSFVNDDSITVVQKIKTNIRNAFSIQ